MKITTHIIVLISCLLAGTRAAADIDAQAIFSSLEASVVAISDPEGGGSGIVLSEDGLILTNFHVANTPLPQKVEALVQEGGKPVRKTFDKVKLQKVHATKDLALLKVDTGGLKLKPAKLSKSEKDTVAGAATVALGYPFVPGQDKPVLTITKGIVSSAKRMVAGIDYIQLDAAINPGNSGGALVNEKGIVIGLPTIKFEGSDSIGLATPIAQLKMDQFVDSANRKGNPEEAKRLSGIASSLMLRDALSFELDDRAVQLALFLQREALSLEPNNPAWSRSMASMYQRLGESALALAYAENSIKIDGKNLYSRFIAAECYDQLGEPEKALAHRMTCLEIPAVGDDIPEKVEMMDKLASGLVSNKNPVRALYVLSWRIAIDGKPLTAQQRLVLQKVEGSVPTDIIEAVMTKKEGHSVADMEALAARTKVAENNTPLTPVAPAEPGKLQPVVATSSKVTSEVKFDAGNSIRMVDAPAGVLYDDATKTLVWTPLPFSQTASVKVLFLITKADGVEEPFVHTIHRN